MIHQIAQDVYRWIREHGRLSREEIAEAIGRKRQVVYRWEQGDQIPSPEQEQILVEKAKCSKLVFAEIMCKKLSLLTGRRVMIAPEDQVRYLPTVSLARAAELYRENYPKLTPVQRRRIEEKLRHGRTLDSVVEETLSMIERDVEREVEIAQKAWDSA